MWGACEGAVGPAPEICDDRDNDCDGQADEGLDCCQRDCGDRQCGSDGCGGTCGNCQPGDVCAEPPSVCLRGGAGLCDPCEHPDQCEAGGTDICIHFENLPAFCSRPCALGCPAGYVCVGVEGLDAQYCAPPDGDRGGPCLGVQCPANQACDRQTGQCVDGECELNADCGADEYCGRNDRICHGTGGGAQPGGRGCDLDTDCMVGDICSDLLRICADLCDSDQDCAENLINRTCVLSRDGNRRYCSFGI